MLTQKALFIGRLVTALLEAKHNEESVDHMAREQHELGRKGVELSSAERAECHRLGSYWDGQGYAFMIARHAIEEQLLEVGLTSDNIFDLAYRF